MYSFHFNFNFQELLAFISLYMVVNLIYRELLVRKSECSDEDDICRQVRSDLTHFFSWLVLEKMRYTDCHHPYFV